MTAPRPPAPPDRLDPARAAAWESGWVAGYLAAARPVRCARADCHTVVSPGAVQRGYRYCSKACREAARADRLTAHPDPQGVS